jgi:hypothetical protein
MPSRNSWRRSDWWDHQFEEDPPEGIGCDDRGTEGCPSPDGPEDCESGHGFETDEDRDGLFIILSGNG